MFKTRERVLRERLVEGVRYGVSAAARHGSHYLAKPVLNWIWDARHGVETRLVAPTDRMGIKGDAGAHAARYEAVRPAILKGALALLPIHYPDFTFLDFGSGKGKALFIASSFPFQRIVGVEMSPSLTEIALANIRSYRDRKQKCHRIEASCCDAADFSIPNEPLTILFYNPFDSVVMRAVLDRITNSITEHPRPVYVIYVAPALSRMFIDYQYLRTLHTARGVVIYGFNPTPTQMRL